MFSIIIFNWTAGQSWKTTGTLRQRFRRSASSLVIFFSGRLDTPRWRIEVITSMHSAVNLTQVQVCTVPSHKYNFINPVPNKIPSIVNPDPVRIRTFSWIRTGNYLFVPDPARMKEQMI